jgi:predicted nucleotidyltransferase
MRIDPKGMIGQYPALLVRSTLRHLRSRLSWGLAELEAAAGLTPGDGRALVMVLRSEGLIEAAGHGAREVTQAGRTLSSATAARRITRATAEEALQEFLDRVQRVNNDPYFLGKVTRVVLFGSMLKPEVERLSDVDVAVEVASKESDFDQARAKNYERVEKLAVEGHRFRNFLEQEGCWYWEVLGFLKGRSRVISLADYATEKPFVLAVPHRVLFVGVESTSSAPNPGTPQRPVRKRRPRHCPF